MFIGITIDSILSFSGGAAYLCASTNNKLHALSHVFKYTFLKKRRILVKSFIVLMFSYCRLILMKHSQGLNNKINHILKTFLLIVCRHFSTSFKVLLAKHRSKIVHYRNLQKLTITIFKVKIGTLPILINKIFNFCRSKLTLGQQNIKETNSLLRSGYQKAAYVVITKNKLTN